MTELLPPDFSFINYYHYLLLQGSQKQKLSDTI
jgi:hypothetical protein